MNRNAVMLSHPDRVRRKLSTRLSLMEYDNPIELSHEIRISIDREEIAAAMSAREVRAIVQRLIAQGIDAPMAKRSERHMDRRL